MIEVAYAAGARLGECPLWDPRRAVLHWVDINGRAVHTFDPAAGDDRQVDLDTRPGSIALTDRPEMLLVAAEHALWMLDVEHGTIEPWIDLEPAGTANRLNDGRLDPAGRFWVGSMHADVAGRHRTGSLHRVEPDGTHEAVRSNVGVSNTLAFSPDGSRMYWSDTFDDLVWVHDFDARTGRATAPRPFVDFTSLPGHPDGACVDEDGALWVAAVHGGAVIRVAPDGQVDRILPVPVSAPTMPAFGGSDLATMYLTSIGSAESASAQGTKDIDGALLALDAGVAGLPEPVFPTGAALR